MAGLAVGVGDLVIDLCSCSLGIRPLRSLMLEHLAAAHSRVQQSPLVTAVNPPGHRPAPWTARRPGGCPSRYAPTCRSEKPLLPACSPREAASPRERQDRTAHIITDAASVPSTTRRTTARKLCQSQNSTDVDSLESAVVGTQFGSQIFATSLVFD